MGVGRVCEVECVEAVANKVGFRGIVVAGCNAKLSWQDKPVSPRRRGGIAAGRMCFGALPVSQRLTALQAAEPRKSAAVEFFSQVLPDARPFVIESRETKLGTAVLRISRIFDQYHIGGDISPRA